jgi:hypothetical protein
MANPKFPYIAWRNGRPRSKHGPRQRKRGFVDQDLKNADGSWFTLEQAAEFSDRRVAEVKASRGARAAEARLRAGAAGKLTRNTVADLLRDWQNAWPASMSDASRRSYRKCISALLWQPETPEQRKARKDGERAGLRIERHPEDIASMPPAAIGKPEFRALHEYMVRRRGAHMARAVIATLSAAWTWGTESTHWRLPPNPRLDMEFETPPGRIVQVTMLEFMALVAAADMIGRLSIGDCFYLGLFTGQRQTDRLRMKDESDVEGRHAFRQSKTGQLVDIKEAPQLANRLDQARARVAAITLRHGLKQRPEEIVINEETGTRYAEKTYGNHVIAVRWLAIFGLPERLHPTEGIERAEAAAAELRAVWAELRVKFGLPPGATPEVRTAVVESREQALREWFEKFNARQDNVGWRLQPCPSLAFVNDRGELDFKHDQDLRDTCVMLLDRAGCDLLTICDITGHSYSSGQTIVKHYRARNVLRADMGIDRLLQVRKEGMTG